jgi:hypothetical protein
MGGWRKLHNQELRDLYSSPSIIRIIKSRWMRWAGHVARIGRKRNAYRILVGKPERKNRYEDQDLDGWILLGCILERWDGMMWSGLAQDRNSSISNRSKASCVCWEQDLQAVAV